MKMPDEVELNISNEDILFSKGYMDPEDCPLAVALKRVLGIKAVSVTPGFVRIYHSNDRYDIAKGSTTYTYIGWDTGIGRSGNTADSFVQAAIFGRSVGPFPVILTKHHETKIVIL